MRLFAVVAIALSILLPCGAVASAETLGDPQVGFSAERVLVFDGHSYIGRMWNMPGEQRHEQQLPSMKPVFILRAGSSIGDVLLPQLHTAVEFNFPKVLAVLSQPDLLGKPVGSETVNGIATTKYEVDKEIPDGHLSGALWLSRDGIPMRCDGSYINRKGKTTTVHWELRHVQIGEQDVGLFAVPADYSKLPPEAAATLLGLRLASHPKH
ncbi:MAG TPA: hypothetical protein VNV18_17450 [Stellaceae bacterium]|jgi:hypothetical protein|nr:hypothetical protein [Stellaceae bacterium]